MTARITYIKGITDNPKFAEKEQASFIENVQHLKQSGAEVTVIGDAYEGFSFSDLQNKLNHIQAETALIVDAHGNIRRESHVVSITKAEKIDASDFYQTVATAFKDQPAHIFMLSCGSGNGLARALDILPLHSSIFNLVPPGAVDSYRLMAEGLSVESQTTPNSTEALFLNIMCKGLSTEGYCTPYLTTKRNRNANVDLSGVRELWDVATSLCCEWAGNSFPEPYMKEAVDLLRAHLPEGQLSAALETLEYYKNLVPISVPARPVAGTPVRASYTLNPDDFHEQVVEHRLLGPIGALIYAFYREEWGAFQQSTIKAPQLLPA